MVIRKVSILWYRGDAEGGDQRHGQQECLRRAVQPAAEVWPRDMRERARPIGNAVSGEKKLEDQPRDHTHWGWWVEESFSVVYEPHNLEPNYAAYKSFLNVQFGGQDTLTSVRRASP